VISDHKLRQHVIAELDFEPCLDASHIAVGVHDGVVTLSGSVSSYADKLAAERASKRVFGVRAIAQEIEIRLPSDKKTADDEIAKRAADILRWRVGVPADQITIKVEKGVVSLAGEVDWQFQRKQAENTVHNLTGVIGINNLNLISVRARPQIPKIKEKIQQALKQSAELDSSHVTVHAEGGTVILGGKVHAWFERDLAEQAAWSAPGVTKVQDHIEIEPWDPVITRSSLQ
jgi:osmotically-inducible protein OsmY